MSVRLDYMRLFAKLAELGSFSRAAKSLDVPKQTLSRRIAALEQELGRLQSINVGNAWGETPRR